MSIRTLIVAAGCLACLSALGCAHPAEQRRAEEYESFLKQELGVAGRVERKAEPATTSDGHRRRDRTAI